MVVSVCFRYDFIARKLFSYTSTRPNGKKAQAYDKLPLVTSAHSLNVLKPLTYDAYVFTRWE